MKTMGSTEAGTGITARDSIVGSTIGATFIAAIGTSAMFATISDVTTATMGVATAATIGVMTAAGTTAVITTTRKSGRTSGMSVLRAQTYERNGRTCTRTILS